MSVMSNNALPKRKGKQSDCSFCPMCEATTPLPHKVSISTVKGYYGVSYWAMTMTRRNIEHGIAVDGDYVSICDKCFGVVNDMM